MDSKPSTTTAPLLNQKNPNNPPSKPKPRDFLNHLEAYLAKLDGVDKLIKISRYATKIVIASSALPETLPLTQRLKSFESSVGVSRKAFRLGKFVQDVNALRSSTFDSNQELVLALIAYGGEGLYFFVEQFVWLVKSGLIDKKHSRNLQKISAWAEFIGYAGRNETKGLKWNLRIRDKVEWKVKNEDMLWLSHWIMGNNELECGEEVCFEIEEQDGFITKELGVQFVYEQQNKDKEDVPPSSEDPMILRDRSPWKWSSYFLGQGYRGATAGVECIRNSEKKVISTVVCAAQYFLCNHEVIDLENESHMTP